MYKKLFYILTVLLLGTFIVFQSCNNEAPVNPSNEVGSSVQECAIVSNVVGNYPGGTYLKFDLSNAGALNGHYPAWCLDLASSHGPTNCAKLYTVGEPVPPELTGFPLIDHPENLIIVNYIINHFQAGVTTVIPTTDTVNCTPAGAAEVVTVDDIQAAIWTLVDEGPGPGAFDQERVNGIICIAKQHRNYDPCAVNEDIAYIVTAMPVGGLFPVQPLIIRIPCCCVMLTDVNGNYPNTYLTATLSNAGEFNGIYNAWCLDLASTHGPDTCVELYPANGPIPPELTGFPLIDHPENLIIINYIINHFQAGVTTVVPTTDTVNCTPAGAAEVVNVDDIQAAIWTLIDEGPGPGAFDQERVNGIICIAKLHRNYNPCAVNEQLAWIIISRPVGGVFRIQPLIIKLGCDKNPPCIYPVGGGSIITTWQQ